MSDTQRDRIAAAFDRELSRSPLPPDLRAHAVHDAVHSRNPFGRQRPPRMLALVAALLAVAIVAALLLSARSLHTSQVVPAKPMVPGIPVPLPKFGALAPGTYYQGPFLGAQQVRFTLPAGWAISNGLVYKHLGQPGEVAFSFWTVGQVYADPCHWQGSALSELDLNNHSHDANGAFIFLGSRDGGLANQALRGPLPRALTQVAMAGVDGGGLSWPPYALRIDLSVPTNLDISTCDQGQFRSWTGWQNVDSVNSHYAPGQLDTVYMVDVDRRPIVIDASHMPATSQADLAELGAIVASMVFDRG